MGDGSGGGSAGEGVKSQGGGKSSGRRGGAGTAGRSGGGDVGRSMIMATGDSMGGTSQSISVRFQLPTIQNISLFFRLSERSSNLQCTSLLLFRCLYLECDLQDRAAAVDEWVR